MQSGWPGLKGRGDSDEVGRVELDQRVSESVELIEPSADFPFEWIGHDLVHDVGGGKYSSFYFFVADGRNLILIFSLIFSLIFCLILSLTVSLILVARCWFPQKAHRLLILKLRGSSEQLRRSS